MYLLYDIDDAVQTAVDYYTMTPAIGNAVNGAVQALIDVLGHASAGSLAVNSITDHPPLTIDIHCDSIKSIAKVFPIDGIQASNARRAIDFTAKLTADLDIDVVACSH